MERTAVMQQTITYIEEHLLEEINYEDAPRQVHTSIYEFHRAFSFLTGMTVNAYIRSPVISLRIFSLQCDILLPQFNNSNR